jgi:ketosteroid isomerase-like protein
MSERDVELLRRWFDAFNARDLEAMIALYDPSIEFHSAFAVVGGAVYHRHDGIRQWHTDTEDSWEQIRLDIEAYFDIGGHIVAFYLYRARGRQSGAVVAMPAAVVTRWRNGLMTYVKVYLDRAEALNDLGVRQEELEPLAP